MMKLQYIKILGLIIGLSAFVLLVVGYHLQAQLVDIYRMQESLIVKDRHAQEVFVQPNQSGYWARYLKNLPPRFKELLINKEDKYFYWHFGFNPVSMFEASMRYVGLGNRQGSSTISQQLVKVLLGQEFERNLKSKAVEAFYTLALEIFHNKEKILEMYANSVYFGNQAQGIVEASRLYFGLPPELLTDGQILQLLASIHSPADTNPSTFKNKQIALALAERMNLNQENIIITNPSDILSKMALYSHKSDAYFEIEAFLDTVEEKNLTCDLELTQKIRKILKRNIKNLEVKDVKNGAVIVIKLPENEILALVGSPDPQLFTSGYQINMLEKPRPIGSTIKPFIYLNAFKKGLRPYTLVDDREYKYITAIGFPLYPKNFDYKYRGEVNLHYALANSLNVPSVKVLEYVGLEDFYWFLQRNLEFEPIQNLENYQLGIALGALEMSLYDLARYFTIFGNSGVLKELKIKKDDETRARIIAEPQYIQLVNKILSDRQTGAEQFGLVSDLSLAQKNYALKTGTSRDFHDSWVLGYTPDFLVGVWLGNADNTAMDAVSGQTGAGRIWAEIMELLFYSEYNKKTDFDFELLEEFEYNGNLEYGLPYDNYQKSLWALKQKDEDLIFNPHPEDVFLFEENTSIVLEAREPVRWFTDNQFLGEGKTYILSPQSAGLCQIKAEAPDGTTQTIEIYLHGAE